MSLKYNKSLFPALVGDEWQWMKMVMDSLHEGVLIVDAGANIIYANPAYTRIFGVPVSRVMGKNLVELEPNSSILRVIRCGQPLLDDYTHVESVDTNIVGNITPVFAGDGLHWVIAVFRDMRDMLELQKKLHDIQAEVEKTKNITNRYYSELQELRARFMNTSELIFESQEMRKVLELAVRLAQVSSTVLINGESGVGKEIIAKFIHYNSLRKEAAFIVINCGAIPDNLLESELFGYERGAFTGANKEGKLGLLEIANQGTLFLDEVAELPLNLQVKLLRVIQERHFFRLGGTKPIEVDIRLLAATNKDLKELVKKGEFREDLYYRLNVVPINIMPLRSRKNDIIPLATSFLDKYNVKYNKQKKLAPDVLHYFENYHWPGNVRELENVVERLVVSSLSNEIAMDDEALQYYFEEIEQNKAVMVNRLIPLQEAKEAVEKELIIRTLAIEGSIRKAAKLLRVDHSTLLRKIKKYHFDTDG